MPDWLKEWWPVIAFVSPLIMAAVFWAVRMGLPSRQELTRGLQAEADARTKALLELDERLSVALGAVDKKVLSIEAEIKHLPTSEDFSQLRTQMARLETAADNTAREIGGVRLSLTRIEDYLLKQGGRT